MFKSLLVAAAVAEAGMTAWGLMALVGVAAVVVLKIVRLTMLQVHRPAETVPICVATVLLPKILQMLKME